MGRATLSAVSYESVAAKTRTFAKATYAGEQRHKEGRGLDPLVDPKGHGLVRRSLSWYEPKGKKFELLRGVAMLEETRLDTTGSMGDNVEIAMGVLPSTFQLLASGDAPVLGRYDTQMITSIFGDVCDAYVLCRSQAELDERIAEQMTLMVPEGGGGDADEDPQYGLFGAAFLTEAMVNKYGLKYYDFTISDARGRHRLDKSTLTRVFGDTVFDVVAENGFQINPKSLPDTRDVVVELKKRAHAFFLQVGNSGGVRQFWTEVFGANRVITLPSVELLPQVKAAIIGLTEGVLDLQSAEEFIRSSSTVRGNSFRKQKASEVTKDEARAIVRAISGIPIGAQKALPGFDKIPLKGALFAKKGDLWPIGAAAPAPVDFSEPEADEDEKADGLWDPEE